MLFMESPHQILGVKASATQEEIKKMYRQLAQRYHPDSGNQANAKRFAQVTEAYRLLKGVEPEFQEEREETKEEKGVVLRQNLYKERIHPGRERQQEAFYRTHLYQAILKMVGMAFVGAVFLGFMGFLSGFYPFLGMALGLLIGGMSGLRRFFDLKTFLNAKKFKWSQWGYWG